MAKTLSQLQQQIQKLEEQADVLRKKEAVGVIAKIKVAIDAYGLTPEDLFGTTDVNPPKRVSKRKKVSPSVKPQKAKVAKPTSTKKAAMPAKYTDGSRFWSGHGKRPQWFKDAIESGKTPEDLAVQPM